MIVEGDHDKPKKREEKKSRLLGQIREDMKDHRDPRYKHPRRRERHQSLIKIRDDVS